MRLGLGLGLSYPRNGGGASSYHADAVHFTVDDTLNINSLSCAVGGTYSASFWLKVAGNNDLGQIYVADHSGNGWPSVDGFLNVVLSFVFGADGADKYSADLASGLSVGAWHHILFSFEVPDVFKVYVDDQAAAVENIFSGASFDIISNGFPFRFSDGNIMDIAEAWIAPTVSLLSGGDIPEAMRRKFISDTGKPVNLGADGSMPTGTAPAIFFSGDSTAFATNRGTGGAFTLTGSLTDASTSPSD